MGAVMRIAIVFNMCMAVLLTPALSAASDKILETSHLIVRDNTGNLSDERLRELADRTQETLNKVIAFWSVDSGIDRFGKIRVVFEVPRIDRSGSFLSWKRENGELRHLLTVFVSEGPQQNIAHKLTPAVLPQKDSLIRNVMGLITEVQVGNPISFPMCGFNSDDWVLALLAAKSKIPLNKLGPGHESWGVREGRGGQVSVFDRARQHKAYAEAGSFGIYLFQVYGLDRIKQFHRLSHEKERPWQDAFGHGLQELETNWIAALRANEKAREQDVSIVAKLMKKDPSAACAEAQAIATSKR
jgi:hypothetical protein